MHHEEIPWIWVRDDDVADASLRDSANALGQEENITQ